MPNTIPYFDREDLRRSIMSAYYTLEKAHFGLVWHMRRNPNISDELRTATSFVLAALKKAESAADLLIVPLDD